MIPVYIKNLSDELNLPIPTDVSHYILMFLTEQTPEGLIFDDKKEGRWIHRNGSVGYYSRDKKVGYWSERVNVRWYPTCIFPITECGHYNDDVRVGNWTFYYVSPNNTYKTRSRGLYKNGRKEGMWEEYNPDGSLYSYDYYMEGILMNTLKQHPPEYFESLVEGWMHHPLT